MIKTFLVRYKNVFIAQLVLIQPKLLILRSKLMKKYFFIALVAASLMAAPVAMAKTAAHGAHGAHGAHESVADSVISTQRSVLAKSTDGKGFGPQSPRDIDSVAGNNQRVFSESPASTDMNLCNIHFHKNAEHKAKDFSTYAGNGDGHGSLSGYKYSGTLTKSELVPTHQEICPSPHGALSSGDTIEVHYVYSTAQITPGPTLGACLNDSIGNPQLRVETQVYVLVNDPGAADFGDLTKYEKVGDLYQATGIPQDTGVAVQYEGSTTGPGYNEKGSPFQVSWSVRPHVAKVNVDSVAAWCKGNTFNEDHAHGVRNLVTNPDLLSEIK